MASTRLDPGSVAATARSVLSCARDIELDIDGLDRELDERLGLLEADGMPAFLCEPQGLVATAAGSHGTATLVMTSAMPGEPVLLELRGRLRSVGVESCTCCVEVRERVLLEPEAVQLVSPDGRRVDVPIAEFRSPAHALNQGYLLNAANHVRDAHQLELREAAAELARIDVDRLLGAQLVDLSAWGATLQWVDLDGSHERPIWFPRVAANPGDLAALLRGCLHPGIC